jgi:RNA polymerase sigma-70 factor (ECF subfamily)
VTADNQSARFEEAVLPHMDAAFNLARWLVRNSTDAQDLVQEAYLRAWKGFAGFHGGDGRSWILTIVRNTCYTWLGKYSRRDLTVEFDEGVHTQESLVPSPERMFDENANREVLEQALQQLPAEFRESIVLRELEGLSYKEISEIAGVPVGTVMSRLARARARLRDCMAAVTGDGGLTCVVRTLKP